MTELCSTAALQRGEPLAGTASRVSRWLLVEQPGPWGPPSVPTARMPTAAARALTAAAAAAGARLLLLRRPGRPGTAVAGRQVFVVDSRPGHERLLGTLAGGDEALAALAQALPFEGPVPAIWTTLSEPLLLVCTHGRHDRCCAVRGRPVAQELARHRPDRTWECSHTGGDRFAANLVVVPHGLYFGQLTPSQAVDVVRAHEDGRVVVEHLRGRSSRPTPVQAAERFARAEFGRDRLEDLVPVAQQAAGPDRWTVRLAGSGAPAVEVTVRYDRDIPPVLLTCGAAEPRAAAQFRCEALEVLDGST